MECDPSTEIAIQFNLHDKSQIEVNCDYKIELSSGFDCDFYFFLPLNIGINSGSYIRDQFYNDLINHLRFHTPLKDGIDFPLFSSLKKSVAAGLTVQEREASVPEAIQEVKLFANSINAILKRAHSNFLCRSVPDAASEELKVITRVYKILTDFRDSFVNVMMTPRLLVPSLLRQSVINSDEFLSNRIIASCSSILHAIKGTEHRTFFPLTTLGTILSEEAGYRSTRKETFFNIGSNERDREYFYYRQSLLKKEISAPLRIHKDSSKQEPVYRNWIAALGAGLAGVWAQLAEYQAHRFQGHKDIGLSFFGIGLLAILAYIFKDRIKDISKEYINDRMKVILPDYKSKLRFTQVRKGSKPITSNIGQLHEFMRFTSFSKIPEEFRYIRSMKHNNVASVPGAETVIHYHKSIRFGKERLSLGDQRLSIVKDIHRFNFSYFLDHLDDAVKELTIYDENEGPSKVEAPKVYHVNVICQLRSEHTKILSHYRVILDKMGIVRIETILQPLAIREIGDLA